MLLKTPATRTPQGALKFVALIIKILSCHATKKKKNHGLRSKLPQLFYFRWRCFQNKNSNITSGTEGTFDDVIGLATYGGKIQMSPLSMMCNTLTFGGKIQKLTNKTDSSS
jgi:hypothetical protein